MFENYSECYHCPGVHPQLQKVSPYDSAENDLAKDRSSAGSMKINPGQEPDHERERVRGEFVGNIENLPSRECYIIQSSRTCCSVCIPNT